MMEKRRLNLGSVLVLNAYWVGLSFMWNSLHVIILPAVLLTMAPERFKNTYLGLLTFTGLIVAMVVQPISGAISDRWASGWGRRRPLMTLGTAFDFLFLGMMAWAGGMPGLAIGYIGLQFSSNIAHGPAQGLLPDQTPDDQMGWASGFKNFMDMFGLIVSSLMMGRLYNASGSHAASIGWVALILAGGALVTLIGVRERPSTGPVSASSEQTERAGNLSIWKELRSEFSIDWRRNRPFAWLIVARLFFLTAIYGIQVFAQYYVRDVIRAENPVQVTGDLLAAITVALTVFAVAGGWLGDRFGHKRMSYAAAGIGAVGCLLLLAARTPTTLLVYGSILGVGIGMFLTANWALANELAPAAEAGKFMGLTNLATAGAGAIGRLEGPGIDLLNNAAPGQWWGYFGLFLMGAICMLSSALALRRVQLDGSPAVHEGR